MKQETPEEIAVNMLHRHTCELSVCTYDKLKKQIADAIRLERQDQK